MMALLLQKQQVLLTLALALLISANAFSLVPSNKPMVVRSVMTVLRAEEESNDDNDNSTSDILSSPAFLKRKIDVLKSDIEEAEGQIAELTAAVEEGKGEWGEQLDKLRSEYSNIQERLGNQNKQGDVRATVQVAREMLSVMDNFDRAFGAVTPESPEDEAVEAEYKATYEQILDTFKELGVTTVETVGTEFNYEFHQAVMQIPSDGFEEGIVCDELQKGFVLGETLIRPAMVAVAA
ncbi:Protein GrpE [Seminavis robusta]|uniref:GrpE protein homolog n=1 Tax=Seminavis robusta TaxID=568900 RepID=A0A9N8H5W8_9STRA|nr:Protein GrpE [Seminavis robusta]|eukprot:Sro84_g044930.1 Protein GrpE (237) ;mRNA; f:80282-81095